ncbi:3-hydroxymyristoyl/3-hydroxydecanoyl-(acyl carrier protein) dehydratase [Succinivibrio dextrinosolvens]|uniref:ApeI family dehydratase n=1 Tax=Succinivibrio dextrinosolvens TaxID=83771 RepID=UPI0008E60C0C|nr:hypothetical protein [Succinivibrio dextrinosolvens]SFS75511.1 3-hydroxymyristoyl/3-hydroxydecanoyl-(acyl carrier protein) dehydratase [Succinivibrio dextrinosolvens]
MIKPNFYTTSKLSENKAIVTIVVNPDLKYFEGHFEAQKVLPGVVQIGWAQEFAQDLFNIKFEGGSPAVKFTSPILPNDRLELTLEYLPEKKRLAFEYIITSKNNEKASSGKLITE